MIISRTLLPAALLLSLLAAVNASAQVYECTDAKGAKTFAKACPAGTVKEKELDSPGVSSPGAPNAPMDEKLRKANEAYEKRRTDRQMQNMEQDKRAADASKAAQACADAKARLDALQTGRPSQRVDPVTGGHIANDDTQIQAQTASLNSQIAQNCK